MPSPDLIRLFVTVCAFAFLPLMIKRPFYGVPAYLLINLIQPGLYYEFLATTRIELIVAVFLMIVLVLSGRFTRFKLAREPINRWMVGFIVVIYMSAVVALDFETAWAQAFEMLKVFFLYIIIVTLCDNEKDVVFVLAVLVLASFIMGYEQIYNYLQGQLREASSGGRAAYAIAQQGLASGHVGAANLQLQAMPFTWFLIACHPKRKLAVAGQVIFLSQVFMVLISASRGGLIGLITLFCCMIYFSKKRLIMTVAGSFVLIALLATKSDQYLGYMSSIFDLLSGGSDLSASSRVSGLKHGIEMMIERPLLGVGPGCYPIARRLWYGWNLWAHNHYGQLMGDLGLAGTLVWFGFLRSYVRRTLGFLRSEAINFEFDLLAKSIISLTVVRLVLGMGSHSLYTSIWYIIAACIVVASRTASSIASPSKQTIKTT